MALSICVEALIRLFFEIINFALGDVTLIFRGHPEAVWDVLQELLRTVVWIFVFYLIRYLTGTRIVSNAIIISIPLMLQAVGGYLGMIPILGWILSPTAFIAAGILSAIAWGFLAITDETVPLYLRFVGLPGMIVLGAISGIIGPFGILMAAGAIVALSTIAKIVVPLSTLIVLLLTWWSPTWFCEVLNSGLKILADVRQEGVVEGIKGYIAAIPILVKNRFIKINKPR